MLVVSCFAGDAKKPELEVNVFRLRLMSVGSFGESIVACLPNGVESATPPSLDAVYQ